MQETQDIYLKVQDFKKPRGNVGLSLASYVTLFPPSSQPLGVQIVVLVPKGLPF